MASNISDGTITQEKLDRTIERGAYRRFNNSFALISLVTMLVFAYLVSINLRMDEVFVGVNGLIVVITILVCLLGYAYGYYLIKGLLGTIIGMARDSRKKDYLKTIYISIISHDLRNFLGAIGLSLQNIKDGYLGPVTDKQAATLNDGQEAIDRMVRMIAALVDISRMETGVTALKKDDLSVEDIVRSQIEKIRPLADEKKIELKIDIEAGIRLLADREKTAQALYNLLHNAVRHTSFARSIIVSARSLGPSVEVEVTSEGEEVPDEELRYLFEGISKRPDEHFEIKDYGLGLAVVRSVVTLHGGSVWIKNLKGIGCAYGFTIPNKKGLS
ncbi:MAG: HAMP domain-containing sensor histidine kinase [Candidatus Omnitrophota bacterium]